MPAPVPVTAKWLGSDSGRKYMHDNENLLGTHHQMVPWVMVWIQLEKSQYCFYAAARCLTVAIQADWIISIFDYRDL